jgi:hypothetical protein
LGQINLQGTIPASIASLTGLQVLDLGFNNVSGQVPSTTTQLKSLRALALMNNSLIGPLPAFNFEQYHDLPGFCAFGGSDNSYCAPLPPGIDKCDFLPEEIATHTCEGGNFPINYRITAQSQSVI